MKKRKMAVGICSRCRHYGSGLPFLQSLPMAIEDTCQTVIPPTLELENGHQIACHLTLEQLETAEADPQKILRGYEKLGKDDVQVVT